MLWHIKATPGRTQNQILPEDIPLFLFIGQFFFYSDAPSTSLNNNKKKRG